MKKRSKRYKEIKKQSVRNTKLKINEAIDLVKKTSTTKFDESIDLTFRINLKQSKGGDFNLRTAVKLPNANGKKLKLAVLCEQDKVTEAKSSGADIVGSEDLLEKISSGKLNFDKLICTPAMMGKLGKHGKVLGPKGLMPNPKLGTVATDVKKAVNDMKNGLIEIKNDKDGNLSSSIGRKSFSKEKIEENAKFLIDFIKKEKPTSMKGEIIRNISISSTMGISFKIGNRA